MAERNLQHEIRLALGTDTRVVLFRNTTGFYKHEGRSISYGVGGPGGADLLGMLSPSGRFVALEIKTDRGQLTDDQERFLNLVRRRGGFATVVRSVDDARAAIDRACSGASE